jgi:hypothetical protein
MPDEASGHRVREHVGDLLHHGGAGQEAHHARGSVVPYRSFPRTEHLGAKRDNAMKELQETRQDPIHVRHDQVQMR